MPRIPLTWLGEHVELPADLTAEQLAADLVRVGLEEEAILPAAVSGPLVVGLVVERTPEEQKNGKTINWCRVDVGPEHNEPGGAPRGIVCGAHNFDVGDHVVVALPGAVLPGPFPIAARKTYGHVSDGMICSQRELGLGDDHAGIIVLSRLGIEAEPGTDARQLLGLGEEVLEINVTPDRGYCFSMRGVAREYSLSTGARFTDHGLPTSPLPPAGGGFAVEIDDVAPINGVPGADRFVAQVVRGVRANDASPVWMQSRLQQAGMRPISLAVDVTNYVMLDLGQPLHAYDLAKVAAPIVVRRAVPGEKIRTLDDVERVLDPEDLLITDSPGGERASRPIGLAAVMGGGDTEVGPDTTDLLLEAAHFDPITVARTARRHKLPSEAAKRFERGVDPELAASGGRASRSRCSSSTAVASRRRGDRRRRRRSSRCRSACRSTCPRVSSGSSTRPTRCGTCSRRSGAGWPTRARTLVRVDPPSWRPDLLVPVDLVEEVARLHGYDQIPSILPSAPRWSWPDRAAAVPAVGRARAWPSRAWSRCSRYPFVGTDQLDALGLPADDVRRRAVRLVNPLSDEQPFMRTNLLVTLLDAARRNVSRGATDVAIFEIGLVTRPLRRRAGGAAAARWCPAVRRRPRGDRRGRPAAAASGRRCAGRPA